MSDTILARRRLRLAMLAVLEQLVGVTVLSPGDWDTQPSDLPCIKLRNTVERKVSPARAMPTFTTSITLEIVAYADGATDSDAQDAIEDLGYRIENAVMAAPSFIRWLQHVANVTTSTRVSASGKRHLGEILMALECETFESFDPVLINPDDFPLLQQLVANVDTIRPFDASGNYAGAAFPGSVAPAPRTAGPDGRNEGTLVVDLGT